jgi:glycosyltransferase involved in cell wall biosynthesis
MDVPSGIPLRGGMKRVHDPLGGSPKPPRSGDVRSLVVAGTGKPPEAELRRLIADDAMPDAVSAEDAIGATVLDDRLFAEMRGIRGRLVRRLPLRAAQAIEVLVRGREYDAILSWSDDAAIMIAALMRIWWRRPAHVAILYWPSKPKKAIPLRAVHRGIDRFMSWPPLQHRFLEEQIGIATERFVDVRAAVDAHFWRPMAGALDLICSAGQEYRDYATLLEALAPLSIRCHIAAGTNIFTKADHGLKAGLERLVLPEGVTVGPMSFVEMRELYARARFVVVPLVPSDMDNGITVILEAFAMGKAVICTDTPGQVGVLEHGVNCLRVPPFDAPALREAIEELWDDPDRCRRLGAAGRGLVEKQHSLDQWTASLVRAIDEAVALRAGTGRRRMSTVELDNR